MHDDADLQAEEAVRSAASTRSRGWPGSPFTDSPRARPLPAERFEIDSERPQPGSCALAVFTRAHRSPRCQHHCRRSAARRRAAGPAPGAFGCLAHVAKAGTARSSEALAFRDARLELRRCAARSAFVGKGASAQPSNALMAWTRGHVRIFSGVGRLAVAEELLRGMRRTWGSCFVLVGVVDCGGVRALYMDLIIEERIRKDGVRESVDPPRRPAPRAAKTATRWGRPAPCPPLYEEAARARRFRGNFLPVFPPSPLPRAGAPPRSRPSKRSRTRQTGPCARPTPRPPPPRLPPPLDPNAVCPRGRGMEITEPDLALAAEDPALAAAGHERRAAPRSAGGLPRPT